MKHELHIGSGEFQSKDKDVEIILSTMRDRLPELTHEMLNAMAGKVTITLSKVDKVDVAIEQTVIQSSENQREYSEGRIREKILTYDKLHTLGSFPVSIHIELTHVVNLTVTIANLKPETWIFSH
tara:strand:- start:79 stop:453 length:375 start_codon:yes stop_codon:yes gene_type:complete